MKPGPCLIYKAYIKKSLSLSTFNIMLCNGLKSFGYFAKPLVEHSVARKKAHTQHLIKFESHVIILCFVQWFVYCPYQVHASFAVLACVFAYPKGNSVYLKIPLESRKKHSIFRTHWNVLTSIFRTHLATCQARREPQEARTTHCLPTGIWVWWTGPWARAPCTVCHSRVPWSPRWRTVHPSPRRTPFSTSSDPRTSLRRPGLTMREWCLCLLPAKQYIEKLRFYLIIIFYFGKRR